MENLTLAQMIQEYLENADLTDVVENADYHGRIIAAIVKGYYTEKEKQ